jgi:hypothetical protein
MLKRMNRTIATYKWYDIAFVKWSVAAFVLMIAKLWDGVLYLAWYWYLVLGVVFMITPIIKMFRKEPKKK